MANTLNLTADARTAYQITLGTDHVEFEEWCLSIGDHYLPECARQVRDGVVGADTPKYYGWLLNQKTGEDGEPQ